MNWIKCSERLPKPIDAVIIRYKTNNVLGMIIGVGYVVGQQWHCLIDSCKCEVDYWQPLPEPPKE